MTQSLPWPAVDDVAAVADVVVVVEAVAVVVFCFPLNLPPRRQKKRELEARAAMREGAALRGVAAVAAVKAAVVALFEVATAIAVAGAALQFLVQFRPN